MNQREITTLMHRLFIGSLPGNDAWVHLMQDGRLNERKVMALIEEYIRGDTLLLFVNAQNCLRCSKAEAFAHVERLHAMGSLRIADPAFNGRVLIEPSLGVGAGHALALD